MLSLQLILRVELSFKFKTILYFKEIAPVFKTKITQTGEICASVIQGLHKYGGFSYHRGKSDSIFVCYGFIKKDKYYIRGEFSWFLAVTLWTWIYSISFFFLLRCLVASPSFFLICSQIHFLQQIFSTSFYSRERHTRTSGLLAEQKCKSALLKHLYR